MLIFFWFAKPWQKEKEEEEEFLKEATSTMKFFKLSSWAVVISAMLGGQEDSLVQARPPLDLYKHWDKVSRQENQEASSPDEPRQRRVQSQGDIRTDPFYYSADVVVEGGLAQAMGYEGRPYTTQSLLRYLPAYDGYIETTNTYRHLTVREQILSMIGEHKHGLWQAQESGFIREYLKVNATGLPASATAETADLTVLQNDYAAFVEDPNNPMNWAGYVNPWDRVSADGTTLRYIDLPISHPKYQGKYSDHVPIDLPLWYCTMSAPTYPNAQDILNFVYQQPGSNVIGRLGKRAGLDITELYTNVVRLHTYPDARAWVNIAPVYRDEEAAQGIPGRVEFVAVDPQRTFVEYYLVERPFFNVPYIFIIAVFDDGLGKEGTHSYIRPQGAYWDHLMERGFKESDFNTEVQTSLFYYTRNTEFTGWDGALTEIKVETPEPAQGMQLYGGHGLNRADFTGGGGACPNRGGDWANYPNPEGGAGWPTQYQEVTPLCDAIVLDMKLFANLMNKPSNDAYIGLPNSGRVEDPVEYNLLSHEIGRFDVENDIAGMRFLQDKENPEFFDFTVLLPADGEPGDPVTLKYSYTHPVRQYISYIGEKPDFPLEYAEPEPGCCVRKDAPYEMPPPEEEEPCVSASPVASAKWLSIFAFVVMSLVMVFLG